ELSDRVSVPEIVVVARVEVPVTVRVSESVVAPVTVRVSLRVAVPVKTNAPERVEVLVTARVSLSVVAPETARVPARDELPETMRAPLRVLVAVTSRVLERVVAPVTSRVLLKVVAPVTSRVPPAEMLLPMVVAVRAIVGIKKTVMAAPRIMLTAREVRLRFLIRFGISENIKIFKNYFSFIISQ
ncbi:hypothetical protein KJ641_03100, partial [Patescibacteria group bacterium]|nr:hypothetical protein [Patescibacteria group bacterium]